MRSYRQPSTSWMYLFTYSTMYCACYWRIPLGGTQSTRTWTQIYSMYDLHSVKHLHGNTRGGQHFVHSKIKDRKRDRDAKADAYKYHFLSLCQVVTVQQQWHLVQIWHLLIWSVNLSLKLSAFHFAAEVNSVISSNYPYTAATVNASTAHI